MRRQNLNELENASDLKIDAAGLEDLTIIVTNEINRGGCLQVSWKVAGSSMTDVVVSRGMAATVIIPADKPIKLIYDGHTTVSVSQQ